METAYSKRRRLPHFDKPWAIYYVTITTRACRKLSPLARTTVLDSIRHFHDRRYDLFAACVMLDHVHLSLQPWFKEQPEGGENIFWSVGELMHSMKSFTAKQINVLEGTHDRYVRGDHDLQEKFDYIVGNLRRANLVTPGTEYPWVSTPDSDASRAAPDVPRKMPGTAGDTPAVPGNLRRNVHGQTAA